MEAGTWLATEVVVPQALGATFEALRPAIERLARARPLDRRLTREALGEGRASTDGALTVIAGELEALAHRPETASDPAARDLERARLQRELDDARGWLDAARARLANDAFVSKAPAAVVEGARAREADLADQVARLEDRLQDR